MFSFMVIPMWWPGSVPATPSERKPLDKVNDVAGRITATSVGETVQGVSQGSPQGAEELKQEMIQSAVSLGVIGRGSTEDWLRTPVLTSPRHVIQELMHLECRPVADTSMNMHCSDTQVLFQLCP